MRSPTSVLSRVDLAIALDAIGEQIDIAMELAEQTRPVVRGPLHAMLAALDEAKRRAAR